MTLREAIGYLGRAVLGLFGAKPAPEATSPDAPAEPPRDPESDFDAVDKAVEAKLREEARR